MKTKDKKTGFIIGFAIFSILAIVGAYGTVQSTILTYRSFVDGTTELSVIFGFLGLFMLICFIFFSKELYQLIKRKNV